MAERIDETQQTSATAPSVHSRPHDERSNRGWLVAVAAAAVIILAVGGLAWLARDSGTEVLGADATPEELLTAFSEAIAAGDADAVVALFTEDALIEGFALGDSYADGAEEIGEFAASMIRKGRNVVFTNIEATASTTTFDAEMTFPDDDSRRWIAEGSELTTSSGLITHMIWAPPVY